MVYKSGQIFLPFCHNAHVWRTDRRTDGRTDGQTEFSSLDRVCITCSAVKSNPKLENLTNHYTFYVTKNTILNILNETEMLKR